MAVRTRNGHVVTDADLVRMAEEAEAGYDLSTWKRHPGRPSLDATRAGQHSPRIEARVPENLRAEMAHYASEEGKSVSEVLRGLAERYVVERRSRRSA
jgi:CopG-like RHH_1 or ribbon-helix-helix domain, RHH_5